jgi:hypothetical protein
MSEGLLASIILCRPTPSTLDLYYVCLSVGLLTSITLCISGGQLHQHYTVCMSVGLLTSIILCMSVGQLHQNDFMSVGLLTSIALFMSVSQLHQHYTMSLYVSRSSNQHCIMYVTWLTASTLHYGFMSVGLQTIIPLCVSVGQLRHHCTVSVTVLCPVSRSVH